MAAAFGCKLFACEVVKKKNALAGGRIEKTSRRDTPERSVSVDKDMYLSRRDRYKLIFVILFVKTSIDAGSK